MESLQRRDRKKSKTKVILYEGIVYKRPDFNSKIYNNILAFAGFVKDIIRNILLNRILVRYFDDRYLRLYRFSFRKFSLYQDYLDGDCINSSTVDDGVFYALVSNWTQCHRLRLDLMPFVMRYSANVVAIRTDNKRKKKILSKLEKRGVSRVVIKKLAECITRSQCYINIHLSHGDLQPHNILVVNRYIHVIDSLGYSITACFKSHDIVRLCMHDKWFGRLRDERANVLFTQYRSDIYSFMCSFTIEILRRERSTSDLEHTLDKLLDDKSEVDLKFFSSLIERHSEDS